MNIPRDYQDFYDLFGLLTDADQSEIEDRTNRMIRKFNPENVDENVAASKEQFETMKIAQDILLDSEKREKYDSVGHKDYIQNHCDRDVDGFTFTGRDSKQEKNGEESQDDDVDELIENDFTSVEDTTEKDNILDDAENNPEDQSDINDVERDDDVSFAMIVRELIKYVLSIKEIIAIGIILFFLYIAWYVFSVFLTPAAF